MRHKYLSTILGTITLIFILATLSSSVFSHPGPTDSAGCHYDSQGRRHCH